MYSDWIDACDAVAKDAADPSVDDDGLNPHYDLTGRNGLRNSELQLDRHSLIALEGDDDGQVDY